MMSMGKTAFARAYYDKRSSGRGEVFSRFISATAICYHAVDSIGIKVA